MLLYKRSKGVHKQYGQNEPKLPSPVQLPKLIMDKVNCQILSIRDKT